MKVTEKTGKTVEDAVTAGLIELGVEREKAVIEVLEEPVKKGLFGLLGTTAARVRISYEDDPGEMALDFIRSVCKVMDVQAVCGVERRGEFWSVNVSGSELGILIGRRGETLEALQYLTNLAVAKRVGERIRIVVDVEGYRLRREETLIRLAKRLSEKVKRTGSRVVLEPMNPHERRIIHTALQDESRISTFSEGDEPNRRVVISLRRGREF
ncbi:Jag N-terminus [Acididesulfobacillus acetoxydans]|uniref:RNA-binding protein KhpB n=1 Tax=Acididesulfobacillus acetoxydans TaxID=1561005 RepID=A0A8S0W1S5_9FIRM|nr:RNA-binding cell elongation regulator Jag/EloR [Acididesulfobacillus acetoxydans]CAA7599818.1 Jag N-terminus [Acididesulfobacillus acetoxydans]CEJ07384.1 Protein jag [Acididesulfobacillus acetoxydans]